MASPFKCNCPRCRLDGIMGPVILITIGALFTIQQMHWRYSFHELWPVILIVIGLVKVAQAMAPTTGHMSGEPAGEAKPNG